MGVLFGVWTCIFAINQRKHTQTCGQSDTYSFELSAHQEICLERDVSHRHFWLLCAFCCNQDAVLMCRKQLQLPAVSDWMFIGSGRENSQKPISCGHISVRTSFGKHMRNVQGHAIASYIRPHNIYVHVNAQSLERVCDCLIGFRGFRTTRS